MSGEIQELGHDGRHFIKEDVSGPPDPRSPSFPPPQPGSGAPASLVPAAPWPPSSAPLLGLPLPCQHLSSLPDWRARDLTLALTPCSPKPSSAHGHQPPATSSGLPAGTSQSCSPPPKLALHLPPSAWPLKAKPRSGQGPISSPTPTCSASRLQQDLLQVSGHWLTLEPPQEGVPSTGLSPLPSPPLPGSVGPWGHSAA